MVVVVAVVILTTTVFGFSPLRWQSARSALCYTLSAFGSALLFRRAKQWIGHGPASSNQGRDGVPRVRALQQQFRGHGHAVQFFV